MKKRLMLLVMLVSLAAIVAACVPGRDISSRVSAIAGPYAFSAWGWQLNKAIDGAKNMLTGRDGSYADANDVADYFGMVDEERRLDASVEAAVLKGSSPQAASAEWELAVLAEQREVLGKKVERTLEQQVAAVLKQQGIYNPIIGVPALFPPVNFALEPPPHLLVISPRDHIESIKTITLHQQMSRAEKGKIEAEASALGVSAMVTELGGFGGTFPTFVTCDADLRFTVDAVAEEWLHQYLAFKPLGFRYVLDQLGISRNYDIITMNETVAGIVSSGIGALVIETCYGDETGEQPPQQSAPGFFNAQMRTIRINVDRLLAEGKIEEAEQYMEEQRQFLASKGYYVRKLNQAYFAFHGSYADEPGSVSPIGADLKELRARSDSLKDFLDTVSGMTGRQDLTDSLK